jgi:hypothetical protein
MHRNGRDVSGLTVVRTRWRECGEPRIAIGSRSQTRKQSRDVEQLSGRDGSAERCKQCGSQHDVGNVLDGIETTVATAGPNGHYKYSTLSFVIPVM